MGPLILQFAALNLHFNWSFVSHEKFISFLSFPLVSLCSLNKNASFNLFPGQISIQRVAVVRESGHAFNLR